MKTKVICGQLDCPEKQTCPHFKEHEYKHNCTESCIHSGHKCNNIIEQRKLKLKRLENNNMV